MGRRPAFDSLFDAPIVVLLNLPALVIIVLAYIWIGLNEAAAIGAVALNKLPNAVGHAARRRAHARRRARRNGGGVRLLAR